MSKKELAILKKAINLREFAKVHYGLSTNEFGFSPCPFHVNKDPGLQFWIGRDGTYMFTDCHTGKVGTIVELVMGIENCSIVEVGDIIVKRLAESRPD